MQIKVIELNIYQLSRFYSFKRWSPVDDYFKIYSWHED